MKSKLQYAAAMTAFGTISIFVRNIPVSSTTLALLRAAIAGTCLLLVRLLSGHRIHLGSARERGLLLLSGAAMGFNWMLLFEAYKYTTVSVATLSYYFAPVIVTAVSALIFRERLSRRQLACFAGATAGLVLVIGLNNLRGGASLRGVGFGLGAAALYATVILLNKRIRGVDGVDRTALQFAAAFAVLLPYRLLTEPGAPVFADMNALGWICLAVVGLFHTGWMYCLYFSSLRHLEGQQAAILSYIDPLVAVLLSCTLLGEPVTALQLAGGALILGCTLLSELAPARRHPPSPHPIASE